MFKLLFFWNVKDPQVRTIRDITEKLKRRNSMFVRPVAPVVNFIYCLYVDKMFDQKQRAIISYFSITDVGSTEYHLKTPKYLYICSYYSLFSDPVHKLLNSAIWSHRDNCSLL